MARQYVNLAQIYGAIDQAKANEQAFRNNELQNQRYQRQMQREDDELARQEGIRNAYRGAIETGDDGSVRLNEKKALSALYGLAPEQAMALQDSFTKRDTEAAKQRREDNKAELADMAERTKQARDIAASIYDDASFEQAKPLLQKIAPQMPLPDRFNTQWRDNITLTADGRLKQLESQLNRDLNMRGQDLSAATSRRGQDLSAATSRRGQDITLRGQNLTDARASERLAFDQSGGVAAVNAKNGSTAPKGEKLTEGMRNNAMYAQRMVAAEKLLGDTTEQAPGIMETVAGKTPIVGTELGANQFRSADRQKALQAQRDWVRAKLRKESGAAIGVDEMNQEIVTYFPQINDDAETIEQKRQAREQATAGLIQSSGSAYTPPIEPQRPTNPLSVTAPNGKVYKFKSAAQAKEFKRQAGIK